MFKLPLGQLLRSFQKKEEPKRKITPKKPAGRIQSRKPSHFLEAESKAREIIINAKDEAIKIRQGAEEESRRLRQETENLKERVASKQISIDKQAGILEERERNLNQREKKLEAGLEEIEATKKEQLLKLEKIAHLTCEEAKRLILEAMEKKLKEEIALKIKEAEKRIKDEADKKAKEILGTAIQRAATDYVAEYTTSTIKLPDEDWKGRIIGKEGKNIRTFEKETGVDVELDETPGEILISSFDSIRRAIAVEALKRLIADGRIQPTRIEQTVKRVKNDFNKVLRQAGEELCYQVGVTNLAEEIVNLLGRFKYRTSYGQSLYQHTLEVINLGKILAAEIGADVNIVKAACLLHDIGKVLSAEVEGPHTQIGVDLLRRHGVPEKILLAIAAHHEEIPIETAEQAVLYAADAISGARPGARYESLENYIKRIKELENIAQSFKGVDQAFAIQAGREVRVIVKPQIIDDSGMKVLANKIAEKIHQETSYPGQVQVNVIRETRAQGVAQ